MSKMFEALDRLENSTADFPAKLVAEPRAVIRDPVPASEVASPAAERKFILPTPPSAAMLREPREARPVNRMVAEAFDASMVLVGLALFLGIFFVSGGAAMLKKETAIFLVPVLVVLVLFYRFLWVLANHDTPGMRLARLGTFHLDGLSPNKERRSVRHVVAHTLVPLTVSRPTGPADRPLIEELVLANRILAGEGVVDAYGYVSVRDDRNSDCYFLACNSGAGSGAAVEVIECHPDGQPVAGNSSNGTAERFIHSEIYRARPDVMAIVHCRAPELIPFGASTVPLLPISHMAAFLGDGVPVFDLREAGDVADMEIGTPTLGKALAETLGEKPAALIRGHGAVVVATSLHAVVGRAYYLTVNARLQQQAIQLGGNVTYITPGEAQQAAGQDGFERAWEFWKQKVAQ